MGQRPPIEERSYRGIFWILAALNLGAVGWVVWDETVTRRPWKRYQPAIQQVSNPELEIVDRCQTCHLDVDRTHPRRRELLGDNHPVRRYGCTVCHDGQGAQTKGIGHRPFAHGRNDPYWDRPLLSGSFAESTCIKCHRQEYQIPGAPAYNRGRWIFEDRRCFGCHTTRDVTFAYQAAPAHDHLRSKTSRARVEAFLKTPRLLFKSTRMPSFWPDGQRASEIPAVAAFLGAIKPRKPLPRIAAPQMTAELVAKGKQIFDRIGCRGCHATKAASGGWKGQGETQGPALGRIGERASARWLAAWMANPRAVWAGTRMPDTRLSNDERDAVVAYLVSLRRKGQPPMTPRWPEAEPALVQTGRQLVLKYGCAGCHAIPGLEGAGRAGPGLEDFGDRTADRLEWGEARVRCEGTPQECWTRLKIKRPRRFGGPRIELLMPRHDLTDDEARDVAIFVIGNRATKIPQAYQVRLSPSARASHEGERLLARYNCRGCHEVGRLDLPDINASGAAVGRRHVSIGGQIRRHYSQAALAPPPLTDAGRKFQYPWLDAFLAASTRLRPWLEVRMPSFALSRREREVLIRYLANLSRQPYPFVRVDRTPVGAAAQQDAAWLFKKLQCYKCHQVSNIAGLKLAELAPDLALSRERLRPEWIRDFILWPQRAIPGTRMPSYFPLADEEDPRSHTTPYADRLGGSVSRQVDALVRLNMSFGDEAVVKLLELRRY